MENKSTRFEKQSFKLSITDMDGNEKPLELTVSVPYEFSDFKDTWEISEDGKKLLEDVKKYEESFRNRRKTLVD